MKMNNVNPKILRAATVLLQESCPDLSPVNLVAAIRQYEGEVRTPCLTVEEAAAWLRIDKRSVQNYIQQGKLKVIRLGKTVRILESSLMQMGDEVQDGGDVVQGQ